MIRLLVVLSLATIASARVVPRHICRPQCLRALSVAALPASAFVAPPDMGACVARHAAAPQRRCLHILVRRCMHHRPDCDFTLVGAANAAAPK